MGFSVESGVSSAKQLRVTSPGFTNQQAVNDGIPLFYFGPPANNNISYGTLIANLNPLNLTNCLIGSNNTNLQIGDGSTAIEIGSGCDSVQIGASCSLITIGRNCSVVSIDSNSDNNTVGDNCQYIFLTRYGQNTVGPYCEGIDCAGGYNMIGTRCYGISIGNLSNGNVIGANVLYCTIGQDIEVGANGASGYITIGDGCNGISVQLGQQHLTFISCTGFVAPAGDFRTYFLNQLVFISNGGTDRGEFALVGLYYANDVVSYGGKRYAANRTMANVQGWVPDDWTQYFPLSNG